MIMIRTYDRAQRELSKSTVCDIEKVVNPRNIYPLIYGMSLCCQKKANGNIISAMQKDLNSNKNWVSGQELASQFMTEQYGQYVLCIAHLWPIFNFCNRI